MASEIRVDKITSLSGVGTITPSSSGIDITGITTVATLKATTGIVTTLTATTGIVTTLTANTVTSLGAVSGTTGTFSGAVSGTTGTFTGDLTIPDKIVHTGDTDTSIRLGVDTVTIETGGSERIRVDSSGRLGIGQNSPTALLHLKSNAPYITFEDDDNNQDWQIQATAWLAIRDQTNSAERLRIDSSGRVMIGQTSSVVPFMITATASNFGGMVMTGVFGDATSYASGVGGGITLSGKYNSGGSQVGFAAIRGLKENGTDGNYAGALTLNTRPNGGNMTERFRIDSNGHARFGPSGDGSDPAWGSATYGNTEVAIDSSTGYAVLHLRGEGGGSTATRFSMGAGDDKFYMAFDDVDARHNIVVQGDGKVSIPEGIELGSGTDGTAANTLNDYEEGTWTPTSNVGAITVTTAHYVKIGSLVYFQAYLTFPSMSGSSEVKITNFPFDVAGGSDYLSCSVNSDANIGGAQLVGQFNSGGFLVFALPSNSKATITQMSSKFVLFSCTIMTH